MQLAALAIAKIKNLFSAFQAVFPSKNYLTQMNEAMKGLGDVGQPFFHNKTSHFS